MSFFKICRVKPLLSCEYFVKKTSNLSKYTKKSIGEALFISIFMKKSFLPCPYDKNVHSLKNTKCFHAHMLLKKTSIFSKTRCSHIIFFKFSWKTHVAMPIFGQKSHNSVKTTLDYGPKKSKGWPFFRFFTKNYCCHSHILSKLH